MAKKPGRPPLPESKKRERLLQLAIKVSEKERELLCAAAGKTNAPVSTWARALLLYIAKEILRK